MNNSWDLFLELNFSNALYLKGVLHNEICQFNDKFCIDR